jgi:hypothetical protein
MHEHVEATISHQLRRLGRSDVELMKARLGRDVVLLPGDEVVDDLDLPSFAQEQVGDV